jgi:hypothetical protein
MKRLTILCPLAGLVAPGASQASSREHLGPEAGELPDRQALSR